MIKKVLISSVAVLIAATVCVANELEVYPIPGVFTSQNINNNNFKQVVKNNNNELIKAYTDKFYQYFPNATKEISDKTKYKTFASYIHVPRASEYILNKTDKLIDIYAPLTMSINFVNMASGELLYSYPVTNYFKYETTTISDKNKQQENLQQLYLQNYKDTVDEVVKKASEDFKPFDIITSVTDTYRSLYILDKGSASGIAKGDLLTDENVNQLSVIYSDLNYSVANKILGKPTRNSNFSKFANTNITQLSKPKILFINDFNDEKLYNIFATALGNEANFSLITTDKTYYDMQTALVSLNMDFKNKNVYNRTLPDYFLKLYFTKPVYAQYKSNKDYFNIDKYSMIACGVVFDKAGRVVYSQCANDEVKNEVVENIRFNDEANNEILAKNVLTTLAAAMQKDIRFKNVKFKIKKTDNQYLTLTDSNGFLKTGNVLTTFKKIKTEKSGKEILVPTWDYRVISTNNGIVQCKMSKPYVDNIDYPSKLDTVQMRAMTRSANKANMYKYNPMNIVLDDSDIVLDDFAKIAFAAMASKLKTPIAMHPADFEQQIKHLNSLGFKDQIKIADNEESNLTIKSVYKIKLLSEEPKGNITKNKYEIIAGIITKKDDEVLKQEALSQEVILVLPRKNNQNLIEFELLKYIYPLIQQIATKF